MHKQPSHQQETWCPLQGDKPDLQSQLRMARDCSPPIGTFPMLAWCNPATPFPQHKEKRCSSFLALHSAH